MERDAALEARRNASRSTIAFAFGSSVPRQVDALQVNEGGDADIMSRSFTCGSSHRGKLVGKLLGKYRVVANLEFRKLLGRYKVGELWRKYQGKTKN